MTTTILSHLAKMRNKNGSTSSYAVNRAGRLYWNSPIPFDPDHSQVMPASARALEQYTLSPSANLENPLVIGAIAAGVLGVAIIASIILGVWIRSKLMSPTERNRRRKQGEQPEVDSTTIMSSISTLDATSSNPHNYTQMESIRLDDTTLDLSLMEQLPVENTEEPESGGNRNITVDEN